MLVVHVTFCTAVSVAFERCVKVLVTANFLELAPCSCRISFLAVCITDAQFAPKKKNPSTDLPDKRLLCFCALCMTRFLLHVHCVCSGPSSGGEQEGYFHQAKAAEGSCIRPEGEVLEAGKRNRHTASMVQVPLLTVTPASWGTWSRTGSTQCKHYVLQKMLVKFSQFLEN